MLASHKAHYLIKQCSAGGIPRAAHESYMRASVNFIFHLLGFGILFTSLLGGFIVERKLRAQSDFSLKLYTASISRAIGLLSPLAALLLLITGIGNIQNRSFGTTESWYNEGWLVAKLILYAIMVLNGVIYGPRLTRSRLKLIRAQSEQNAPPNAAATIHSYNAQLTLFYIVQTILLFLILYLSVFGSGKHPGAF